MKSPWADEQKSTKKNSGGPNKKKGPDQGREARKRDKIESRGFLASAWNKRLKRIKDKKGRKEDAS